jgi:hypothetical protein
MVLIRHGYVSKTEALVMVGYFKNGFYEESHFKKRNLLTVCGTN